MAPEKQIVPVAAEADDAKCFAYLILEETQCESTFPIPTDIAPELERVIAIVVLRNLDAASLDVVQSPASCGEVVNPNQLFPPADC